MLDISGGPLAAVEFFRPLVLPMGEEAREHWAEIETFMAVALRVLAKTNPSKILSEVRTVEISTLLPPEKRSQP